MQKVLLAASLVATVAGMGAPASANDDLVKMQQDAKHWVMPTGNYANQRYSKLSQITSSNVAKLAPAWTFSTGVLRGHEGGPLVIGDTMFIHTPFPNIVFALDLNDNGRVIWKYEPKQDPDTIPVMCCDTVNRGVSYADGKVILHQADTTVVALDAKTGKEVWKVANGDAKKGETGTSVPHIIKDKVIVGISGGEFGVRGSVTAYNLKDGSLAWRAYSMGPDSDTLLDPEKTTHLGQPVGKDFGTATWEGDQWKIGGGTTWGWYSYDPDLDLFYYGSGNPSTWNPKQRPGDNRWSMTIFARDPDDGMAKWVYQMTPHDEWDYDGVNEMILADIDIGGKTRNVLVHFDRNGFGYTMDRITGELLVAEKYDPAVNWATNRHGKSTPDFGKPDRGTVLDRRTAKMSTPRASARRLWAPKTSSRPRTHRRPTCSTCRPTMSAWTTSRSASATRRVSPTSVPLSPCIRRRVTATRQLHRLGRRRARSSGRTPSSSPCGAVLWRLPATSYSTARSKAT